MIKKFSALITVLIMSIAFLSTNVFADTTYEVNKKLLVVLVEFTETAGTPATPENPGIPGSLDAYPDNKNSDGTYKYDGTIKQDDTYYSNLFFGTTGRTVRNYYREVSEGKLDYIPAEETCGFGNDGVVRVRLPIAHPNEYVQSGLDQGVLTENARNTILQSLFAAGLPGEPNLLDSSVDFSIFDTDSSNSVFLSGMGYSYSELNIALVLASGENGPRTRAHCSGCEFNFDNKLMTGMMEFNNADTSLGTFCHETAHILGAVDLYNMQQTYIYDESLMSHGSDLCTHLDPYHEILLGFVTPTSVTSSGTYMVNSIDPGNPGQYNVLKIPIPREDASEEYFLVENRQLTGFDSSLLHCPSGGIAVWHVKESSGHLEYIRLERANATYMVSDIDYWKPYFYNGGADSNTFSPTTLPSNSKSFSGRDGIVTITVNGPCSNSMSVNVNILTPPQNFKASAEGSSTKLTWDPVVNAAEYEISVDKGEFFSVGSNTSYIIPNKAGKHSYKLRVKDINGGSNETKELDTIGVLYGDVNRDGKVDVSDNEMLSDYLLGIKSSLTETQTIAADVDGSGDVEAYDLSLINLYINNPLTHQFPIGQLKLITYGDVNGDGLVTSLDRNAIIGNQDGPNGEKMITDPATRVAAAVTYCNSDGSAKITNGEYSYIQQYLDGVLKTFWIMTAPNAK